MFQQSRYLSQSEEDHIELCELSIPIFVLSVLWYFPFPLGLFHGVKVCVLTQFTTYECVYGLSVWKYFCIILYNCTWMLTVKSRKGKPKKVIDIGYLACEHHVYMTVGVALGLSEAAEGTIAVIGLGGGGLCTFLQHCFQKVSMLHHLNFCSKNCHFPCSSSSRRIKWGFFVFFLLRAWWKVLGIAYNWHETSFTLVWQWHQLLFGSLHNGCLSRVSHQL